MFQFIKLNYLILKLNTKLTTESKQAYHIIEELNADCFHLTQLRKVDFQYY
jgi:hypothetical protein